MSTLVKCAENLEKLYTELSQLEDSN
jgi:hypothetical protein